MNKERLKKYQIFIEFFTNSNKLSTLISLRLLDNKTGDPNLKQIIIKPVILKSGEKLQFIYRYKTKDITKNYDLIEAIGEIEIQLTDAFHQAEMAVIDGFYFLSRTQKSNWKLKKREAINSSESLQHNKKKNYLISEEIPFLMHLGVTDDKQRIRSAMHAKFRQINKFVETVISVIDKEDLQNEFKIADMGSGKGYLSFSLYHYLNENYQKKIYLKGIELRKGLVEKCNNVASICGYDNLSFEDKFIQDVNLDNWNMLIALHACNTATDDAIYKGIKSNAKYIICSPCCHKQIRKQLEPESPLNTITQFGILKERQAEIITDTIRALLLQSLGYKTNVMEFISNEHTSKNLLIIAKKVKTSQEYKEDAKLKIDSLKSLFGIKEHHLESLLRMNK